MEYKCLSNTTLALLENRGLQMMILWSILLLKYRC